MHTLHPKQTQSHHQMILHTSMVHYTHYGICTTCYLRTRSHSIIIHTPQYVLNHTMDSSKCALRWCAIKNFDPTPHHTPIGRIWMRYIQLFVMFGVVDDDIRPHRSSRGLASGGSRYILGSHWTKEKSRKMEILPPVVRGRVLETIWDLCLKLLNDWFAFTGILSSKSSNHGENAGKQ